MKKVFFALATMVVLALTSCTSSMIDANGVTDPNQEVCWEIKVTASYAGASATETTYVWGTQNDVEVAIEAIKDIYDASGIKYKIKAKHVNKSEAECDEADYQY